MSDVLEADAPAADRAMRTPRIGFLGVGWIGRNRMEAMVHTGAIDPVAVADPSDDGAAQAQSLAPGASRLPDLQAMLDHDLDGLVIATPSALHAEQTLRALERGVAVFCQKPLGRSVAEVRAVVNAARTSDRLLGVDLSYRHTAGVRSLHNALGPDGLGALYAGDFVFHNAYGPDKPWFYDPRLSGGGCMMDLGVHMIDLALGLFAPARVVDVHARLLAAGKAWPGREVAEDYGVATLTFDTGAIVRIACSWRLPAGQDAVISASIHGRNGGAEMVNVGGSFYDFAADRLVGTSRQRLCVPPDDWGGRAAAEWARDLAAGKGFQAEAGRELLAAAEVLDAIYAAASR